MNLTSLAPGADAHVTRVLLDPGTCLRLGELGIRAGALVRVSQRAAFGGRVLAVGADRFALDSRTCGLIEVEPLRVVGAPGERAAS